MTVPPGPETILSDWLADGPAGMPADVRARIVASTLDHPQAVVGGPVHGVERRARRDRDGSLRLLVPLAAAIGLALSIGAGSLLLRTAEDGSGPFVSARYGYAFDPPDGWTAEPATSDWRVTDPWDAAPAADVFRSPDGVRFTVVGDPVGSGTRRTIYAQAFVPDRPEWDRQAQACRFAGPTGRPGSTSGQLPTVVDGRPAWVEGRVGSYAADVRAACGYVDAVVFRGSYAYVLSLAGPPRPDGDLATFGRLASTFTAPERTAEDTPAPTPPRTPRPTSAPRPLGPLDVEFVSSRYAFTIRHPVDWLPSHATETYVPGRRSITRPPVADHFDGPGRTTLSVVAVDLAPSIDLDTWLQRWTKERFAFGNVCKFGGTMLPGSSVGWQPTTVGGHDARIRLQCAVAEAAIRVGDRLWFVAHDSGQRIGGAERDVLDAFLATMRFDAEAAIGGSDPVTEHHSARYGYSILTPTGWTFEPATEDFAAGGLWATGPAADRYLAPSGERFAVVAADLPGGMTLDAWIDRYAPSRLVIQADGHQHCLFRVGSGTTIVESSASGWYETPVAGHDARVRSECASIDAAVLAGRRVFLMTHDRGHPAPYGDRPAFDLLADSVWIDADKEE